MSKEPSLDFLKSISKFKKNTLKKKSGKYNYQSRIKLIDDFLITKKEYESGRYKQTLESNPPVDMAEQIKHRITRFKYFLETLPNEIMIPKSLYDSFNNKEDIYKYFITFRRKNKVCFNIVEKIDKLELETASKIIDNFYIIDNLESNKNTISIKKIHVN